MTTKDLVYLSLLILSAVVFYAMGFYGGFDSTIKELRRREKEDRRRLRDAGVGSEEVYEQVITSSRGQSESVLAAGPEPMATRRQTTPSTGVGAKFPIQNSLFGRN